MSFYRQQKYSTFIQALSKTKRLSETKRRSLLQIQTLFNSVDSPDKRHAWFMKTSVSNPRQIWLPRYIIVMLRIMSHLQIRWSCKIPSPKQRTIPTKLRMAVQFCDHPQPEPSSPTFCHSVLNRRQQRMVLMSLFLEHTIIETYKGLTTQHKKNSSRKKTFQVIGIQRVPTENTVCG